MGAGSEGRGVRWQGHPVPPGHSEEHYITSPWWGRGGELWSATETTEREALSVEPVWAGLGSCGGRSLARGTEK